MQRLVGYILLMMASLLLVGCPAGGGAELEWGEVIYAPHSARGYEIVATEGASTVLRVLSPWPGSEGVVKEVFISRDGEKAPQGFRGMTVKSNPRRIVCMSSSHLAFLDAVGCVERVVGVSGADYISNSTVTEGLAEGSVREVGYDANINYEVLASLRPDVVFIYGTTGENGSMSAKLTELGIPYIYIADHTELTPLGKSEWVVAFGEVMDCREEAEELFGDIAERYESLRLAALSFEGRPKVMLNSPYKDIWFVPADDSYVVRLIEDAGGEYVCRGGGGSLSRPISGESAYVFLAQADYWLHPNEFESLEALVANNPKFANTKVIRAKRVYNCNARRTEAGGSDFWESGALRADIVLADMIAILHPEMAQGHTLYYYKQLR